MCHTKCLALPDMPSPWPLPSTPSTLDCSALSLSAQCYGGYFCKAGAATPIPCGGGTFGNGTGLSSVDQCVRVTRGFWAPLGSPLPETCSSGFYCPGYDDDDQNDPPGSKPLIMPTGGSAEVQVVEVVKQVLSLDMTCADFDYDTIVQALASQYSVDASLISFDNPCASQRRGRTLATLTLTIEIAVPSTGATTATSASDVASAMSTVSATALASSIGGALGTTVNVLSMSSVQQATEERTVTVLCEAGKWCTAGLVIACDQDTYSNATGQTSAVACTRCPEHSGTVAKGSTSIDDCLCDERFYDAVSGHGVECATCPQGTDCTGRATIDELPMVPGWWRTAVESVVPERCSYQSNCRGGTNASAYCPLGNTGPLCAVCAEGFRKSVAGSCVVCEDQSSMEVADLLPMVLVLLALLACCACFWHARRHTKHAKGEQAKRAYRERPKERQQRIIGAFITKLKIMTAHQQVLQGFAGVFQIKWPSAFKKLLSYFQVALHP